MQNIELFDEYVARTLGMLYGSFPIRIGLDALQMSGNPEVDDFGVPIDERGKRSKAFDVCMATIEWLIDTGYIDCKERDQYGYKKKPVRADGSWPGDPQGSSRERPGAGDHRGKAVLSHSKGIIHRACQGNC